MSCRKIFIYFNVVITLFLTAKSILDTHHFLYALMHVRRRSLKYLRFIFVYIIKLSEKSKYLLQLSVLHQWHFCQQV